MALERTYNIPLRKDFLRAPRHKRANKAVHALKLFLQRHMKSENIKIGLHLNKKLWEHGIKNPPHHVKVKVVKEDDGTVKAELFDAPADVKKEKVRKAKTEKKTETKEKVEAKEQPQTKPKKTPAKKKEE